MQTPGLVLVLYESQTLFRQIFTDGRRLPDDPQPAWLGYSVGRWDGDTLVVQTAGFTDQTWLDGSGHPHTEAMRLTERFTQAGRRNARHRGDDRPFLLYTWPIVYTQRQSLQVDGELIEDICNENHEANLQQMKPKP